jgi:hypothetical protein
MIRFVDLCRVRAALMPKGGTAAHPSLGIYPAFNKELRARWSRGNPRATDLPDAVWCLTPGVEKRPGKVR